MIRILVAVDFEVLRPRLRAILSEISGVETVHDVANVQHVANEVREFKPDIVILSLLKLSHSSTRLASLLRAENPDLPLIALISPFTNRDEATWQKVGVDRTFNITSGHKLLIDYICAFVASGATRKRKSRETNRSRSKEIFHESEKITKETR
ncbi:MAG: hypothetical protein WAO19_08635 [Candidatus Kryptoniota bacterium]